MLLFQASTWSTWLRAKRYAHNVASGGCVAELPTLVFGNFNVTRGVHAGVFRGDNNHSLEDAKRFSHDMLFQENHIFFISKVFEVEHIGLKSTTSCASGIIEITSHGELVKITRSLKSPFRHINFDTTASHTFLAVGSLVNREIVILNVVHTTVVDVVTVSALQITLSRPTTLVAHVDNVTTFVGRSNISAVLLTIVTIHLVTKGPDVITNRLYLITRCGGIAETGQERSGNSNNSHFKFESDQKGW